MKPSISVEALFVHTNGASRINDWLNHLDLAVGEGYSCLRLALAFFVTTEFERHADFVFLASIFLVEHARRDLLEEDVFLNFPSVQPLLLKSERVFEEFNSHFVFCTHRLFKFRLS